MANTTYTKPEGIRTKAACIAFARHTALQDMKIQCSNFWSARMSREFTRFFDKNIHWLWTTPNSYGGRPESFKTYRNRAPFLAIVAEEQFANLKGWKL